MRSSRRHSRRNRIRQIANTLAHHGLGYLVGMLGLERFVPFHKGLLKHPRRAQPFTRPEHVRMAFEELGATFTKLGLILSTDLESRHLLVVADKQSGRDASQCYLHTAKCCMYGNCK